MVESFRPLSSLSDRRLRMLVLATALFAAGGSSAGSRAPQHKVTEPFAALSVQAGRAGCTVQIDATPPRKTNAQGAASFAEVEPTDHYLHVRCPGEAEERAYFFSPHVGEKMEINAQASPAASQLSPLDAAEAQLKLRQLLQEALSLRARGRLEDAVRDLREATKLDPENSDLHRELGITFLLSKDWKRAEVEMLEAIRHKPDDADAHNGLGYALEKLGNLASALKEYRTATQLDPDDVDYREHYLDALAKLAGHRASKKKP